MKKLAFLSVMITLLSLSFLANSVKSQGFSYSNIALAGTGRPIGGANVSVCLPEATSAAVVANNLATLTVSSTTGFVIGTSLTVAGFTGGDTYFNGTYTIIALSSTTLTYNLSHVNATAGTNGTVLQTGNATTACAPTITLYTDYLLTTTKANPVQTDGLGNYSFAAPPGQYYTQIYRAGVTTTLNQVSLPCVINSVVSGCASGGGGGTPGGSTTQMQYNNAGSFGGTAGLTWISGTSTLAGVSINVDFSGATVVKVPVTTTDVLYSGTGGAINGDPLFTYRTANTILSVGPLYGSFSAAAQALFNNPQTTTFYGFVAGRLCTTTGCGGAAGIFQSEGDNIDGLQAISINHSTILGNSGGDINGAEYFAYYNTTVSTTRGAVGNGSYAEVNSDFGHTSGGAVGIVGYAANTGVGTIIDDPNFPLASFITYGNDNYSGLAVPRSYGFEVAWDMNDSPNASGTFTQAAAFHAVAQTGYAIRTEGGSWHKDDVTASKCARWDASKNLVADSADCGGGGGGVTSLTGTANQITVSAATGAVTISVPANPVFTGTVKATTAFSTNSANAATTGLLEATNNTVVFAARDNANSSNLTWQSTTVDGWLTSAPIAAAWFEDKNFVGSGNATGGMIRMPKSDTIDWRNNAGSANLALSINGSDQLVFEGSTLPITKTVTSSQWLRSYDAATGLFTASQPAISDITMVVSVPLTLSTNTLACSTCAIASGLTANRIPKISTSPSLADSLFSDDGTTATYTGTGGVSAAKVTATGSGAGAFVMTQGSAQGHATANTVTLEAPAAVTAYEMLFPAVAATGLYQGTNAAGVVTTAFTPIAFSTQTDAATITWAIGGAMIANGTVTLGGSRTLNITGPVNGGSYNLKIVQDGTGSRGLTLGTGCTWKVSNGGAGAITPSTGANAIDILSFTYDGTNCYANFNTTFN